jgi:hypothetical protein
VEVQLAGAHFFKMILNIYETRMLCLEMHCILGYTGFFKSGAK